MWRCAQLESVEWQVFELSSAASLQAFAEPEVAERLARIFQEAEAEVL